LECARQNEISFAQRRIALVSFSDPTYYPPTLNAAQILARRGWCVDLLGTRWRGKPHATSNYPSGVNVLLHSETGAGIDYYAQYARFFLWACQLARRNRYHWIYCYDMLAAPLGRAMARLAGARWAYHNHDLEIRAEMSPTQRWLRLKELELGSARHADLIVFPQRERARMFADAAGLREMPQIVFNCPPLAWNPDGDLDPRVAALRARWPRLVVYQGGLNSDRGVRALIESLPHWPDDAALVLVGDPRASGEIAMLEERVRELGLGERVLWAGNLGWSYRALPGVTRAGALGVAITPPCGRSNINLEHLAGASNKVFEYMACGLAVLAPDTPGFRELIEEPGYGQVCVDYRPQALGRQITALLDTSLREKMRARNLDAYRTRFNYEHQFAPIVARLES
jgi:glycosyltransferase involved in cell wall biosynthesis